MATVKNDRDALLLGLPQRTVNSQQATILITSDSPAFHVTASGTTTPSYITFTSHLLNITGTATFTANGATITDNGDGTATVAYNGMSGASATITASVTSNGQTYTASTTLTKVVDGSAGQSGSTAYWVEISTFGGQVFSRATPSAAFAPTSITLNATPYGGNASAYQWQYYDGSAWQNISGATSATYTISSGDFTTSRNYRVQATIAGTVYVDEMTIVQVTGGTNSISGFLTNQSITLAADTSGNVGSFAAASGTFKVYDGTTDKTGSGVTYSVVSQTGCTASIASTGVYSVTAMTADTATVNLQAVYNGVTIPLTVTLAKSKAGVQGSAGAPANQYATAFLYQWSSAPPAAPTGTSNYTWATGANSGYVTADGWSVSVPTNPGTPNLKLYVASIQITAASGTTSSSVSYSGAGISAWTQNGSTGPQGNAGAAGMQSANVQVYQWAVSIPAGPSGSSTYTWNGGAIGTVPSGWTASPGTSPSPGMTLWAARYYLTDSATVASSIFNWSSASVVAVGYAGANGTAAAAGASYVAAYCASATPTTTTTPAQTTGKTSVPAANDGGITGTWQSTVPTLTSGQYLYQSDGIYDPSTNLVTWSIPYWSSLKVGSLSAITANLGAITAGSININSNTAVIDAAGNSSFKSITITDANGNVILQSGGQLALSAVPSAALNSNVNVGGRNLLLDSSFENGTHPCSEKSAAVHGAVITSNASGTGATSAYVGNNFLFFDTMASTDSDAYVYIGGTLTTVVPGQTYTLSFYYKSAGNISASSTFWRLSDGSHIGITAPVFGSQNTWQRSVTVWTCPAGITTIEPRFGFHASNYSWMAVDAIKIEVGNTVTDWSPSVEDVNSAIATAATTSTWAGVSGSGRPQDNATVGATIGTNLNGQITSSNSSAYIGNQAIGTTQISDLRTTNYSEDASGNPTAGVKLSSTGNALKVASNSMQIGTLVLSDYWFRLVQGVDGTSSTRLIWRGNNDSTTRGGAPNIACLSVTPMASMTAGSQSSGTQTIVHSYSLTPTTYNTNTDNLDAIQQIHVQLFTSTTATAPFTEFYQACPSRTYDGNAGVVHGNWTWQWYYNSGASGSDIPADRPWQAAYTVAGVTNNVYNAYLRIRVANTYGWSAQRDFGPTSTNFAACPSATITGVAASSGGGSGGTPLGGGGACPAPWVKVRLLNGTEVDASSLHNGARLAAVNDTTMQPLPQGGVVRELNTIWAQRYRVKLTNGGCTEWSENHRFAVAERGWVTVQNLRGGDQILGLQESIVESVLAVGEGQVVSFRVEGAGTYFAGGLLCHNTKASF